MLNINSSDNNRTMLPFPPPPHTHTHMTYEEASEEGLAQMQASANKRIGVNATTQHMQQHIRHTHKPPNIAAIPTSTRFTEHAYSRRRNDGLGRPSPRFVFSLAQTASTQNFHDLRGDTHLRHRFAHIAQSMWLAQNVLKNAFLNTQRPG